MLKCSHFFAVCDILTLHYRIVYNELVYKRRTQENVEVTLSGTGEGMPKLDFSTCPTCPILFYFLPTDRASHVSFLVDIGTKDAEDPRMTTIRIVQFLLLAMPILWCTITCSIWGKKVL